MECRKVRRLLETVWQPMGYLVGGLRRRFFGISMSSEREVLLILEQPGRVRQVLDAVVRAGRLDEPAHGAAFVLSVDEVKGIVHRGSESR